MATQDIAELVQLLVATKLDNERLRAVALMRTNQELEKLQAKGSRTSG